MKIESRFKNGQQLFFIQPENVNEDDFVRDFFKSHSEINEQLSCEPVEKVLELILSKSM